MLGARTEGPANARANKPAPLLPELGAHAGGNRPHPVPTATRHRGRRALAIAVVVAGAVGQGCQGGCPGRSDLVGERRLPPGLADRGRPLALERGTDELVVDLYDNRAAAVTHADGGLVVECGGTDMAKYVDGAYRSAWHLHTGDGGQRVALVNHLAGELYLPVDSDPGGVTRAGDGSLHIALRARAAVADQLVSVFLNERRLGDIAMPTTAWRSYHIRAPGTAVRAGANKLRFYFRHTGEIAGKSTAAALARMRVGARGTLEAPVLTAESVSHRGEFVNALRVSGPARLSYYVYVPTGESALRFAHASAQGAALAVHVARAGAPRDGDDDGGGDRGHASGHTPAVPIWTGQAGASWQQARVDLRAYAGEIVRLDLISAGPADWGRPQLVVSSPTPHAVPARPEPADHVIVWVVSSLRVDRVAGMAATTAGATPGFARLAERGIRAANAFTAAPVPGAAHVALLTGAQPQANTMPAAAGTLAEHFRDAGYFTVLISGNGFVNEDAGFARGFAVYENPMRRRHPFQAHILWQRARRLLHRHRNDRTFVYLATVEPHLPYTPTTESLQVTWGQEQMPLQPAATAAIAEAVAQGTRTLTAAEQSYMTALYDAEVRDADAAFARMLADVDELGIADRTSIVLVGDHGEELGERGGFGHGRHLHQEVLHVPLVIAPPDRSGTRAGPGSGSGFGPGSGSGFGPGSGRESGRESGHRAGRVVGKSSGGPASLHNGPAVRAAVARDLSLIDVHATILDLAGIAPSPDIQGASLFATPARPRVVPTPIFAHLPGHSRALKLGRYKWIVPRHGRYALYDLARDPGEQTNLAGKWPVVEQYVRNVFGIGVAYEAVWSGRRWGHANNLEPAFAADHGL